jgi:hypothetical protein
MSIANVQSASGFRSFPTGPSVVTSVPFASGNTAGNTIVVYVSQANGLLAVFSVSDTQGNTYTQVGAYVTYVADLRQVAMFVAKNVKAGANTVSVAFNQSCGGTVIVAEYSGNSTVVSPIFANASDLEVTGNCAVTLSNPANCIVALFYYQSSSSTISPPLGFTLRKANSLFLAPDASVGDGVAYWDKFVAAAGGNTYTMGNCDHSGHPEAILFGVVLTDTGPGPFLSDLVTDVCVRSGLSTAQIDVTQIAAIPVRGYLLTSQVDAKTALQNPFAAYFVDAVESDFKLRFVPRGANASVLQIPEDDLGLAADKAKLTEIVTQQQELPREVAVTFIDPGFDASGNPIFSYLTNAQSKQRHSRVIKSKQAVTMSIPMVLSPTEARQIAEKALYLAAVERFPFDLNLWKMAYAVLDPTDSCQFVYEGHVYQVRLVSSNLGVGYSMSLAGVSESSSAYQSVIAGGSAQGVPALVGTALADTVLFLADIPYLQDSDAATGSTGYYWAAGAPTASNWPGSVLYKSADNTTFDAVDGGSSRIAYGTIVGTLGDPVSLWSWDTTNTITINMANGTLAGDSDMNVLNGSNPLIVGKEVLQYANAVLNMDGSYTLSRLLRGRRNTEQFAYGHTAGEIAWDPSTGVQRETTPLVTIGLLRYYRGVTVGKDITLVASRTMTLAGNDLKPAFPVHLTGARDGSNNLTLGWTRRTRYSGDWLNNTGNVPLNEVSERYEIDVYSGASVVRTITWTSGTYDGNGIPTAAYSAANQVSDGLTPGSPVHVKVYQVSDAVGRGFPADATV